MIADAKSVKRPIGAICLAVLFAWLGLAGILNAVIWPLAFYRFSLEAGMPELPLLKSSIVPILAFGYGISALAFAIGLWGLKNWALQAYTAWLISIGLLMLFLSWQMTSGGNVTALSIDMAFGAIGLIPLLAWPWFYTSRLLRGG